MPIYNLERLRRIIRRCLDELYQVDGFLFRRNAGRGVCERCLTFRFAHHLQNKFTQYFVDCDFNSSFTTEFDSQGRIIRRERSGKAIRNLNDTETKRFIDIIVHKRDYDSRNDFICFEIKKWNNDGHRERNKDYLNLARLTTDYGYFYGFHVVLGRVKVETKWTIFHCGQIIIENEFIFNN